MRPVIAIAALVALTGAAAPGSIEGYWANPSGTAIIAISSCGAALCGKVAWASERGRREASRSTPDVVGTMVLTHLKPAGDSWTGSLFIPDDDIHVSARLRLVAPNELKLTGCALSLLCRSQLWTRKEALPNAQE